MLFIANGILSSVHSALHIVLLHIVLRHTALLHTAHSSHHLVGNGICLRAVYIDGTAVLLCGSVIVEGRLRVYADCSAVDIEIAVGVDSVGVALPHINGDVAAVYFDSHIYGCRFA